MNLRGIDLNLLVVLDALLDEAHVSRAAERLGMSQPAASNALDRCRALFRDPLLERGRGTMRLTPRAEALRGPLRALLAEVEGLVDPPPVPLEEIQRTVRLVMADHPASVVLATVVGRLRRTAPGIDLVVRPWMGAAEALEALTGGTVDLGVSVFPEPGPDVRRIALLHERYRVVMRRGHPAAAAFDLDAWLAHPHVLVSARGDSQSPVDAALGRLGRSRRVGVVVPAFSLVPGLLADSDLIALLPSRCLSPGWDETLTAFEPPIAVQGFPLHLAWHVRRDRDPAVRHVGDLVREAFAPL